MTHFEQILENQRIFFKTHKTKDLTFRRSKLQQLKKLLSDNEKQLYEAIHSDFGKSGFDTYTTEIAILYSDIDYYTNNLNRLAKPRSVKTNLVNLPGSSSVYSEPLGCTLVIGAWNYPYQLSLAPMIAAIAAGNTCIIKPSEVAPHTMKLMAELINYHFQPEYLFVAEGGVEEMTEILKLKFDKIFFTGSPKTGRIIYEAAAKHLTPVTLELGGKSPAIVTESADLELAAKRIVWGKFLNAGQTCVAPDYILADEKIQTKLLEYLRHYIQKFEYGPEQPQYTRIINDRHFERLKALIDPQKIYYGGKSDASQRYIEPTLLQDVSWDDAVMQEEIFGPVLPVRSYRYYREALNEVLEQEKPLAAYLFSKNDDEKDLFTKLLSFGGGCINDVVMHLSNPNLPFGGVGNSGTGAYHGTFGFDAFSHKKSVLSKAVWGEPNLKYPPYSDEKMRWIRKVM